MWLFLLESKETVNSMGDFPVLNQNKDFRTLYYRGKSQVHPLLVTYARKTRGGETRVGITVSKKVGTAVKRSRCRRVIRAAYRSLRPRVAAGFDLVFVARTRTAFVKSDEVLCVMEKQLATLGVLSEEEKTV